MKADQLSLAASKMRIAHGHIPYRRQARHLRNSCHLSRASLAALVPIEVRKLLGEPAMIGAGDTGSGFVLSDKGWRFPTSLHQH